MDQGQKEQCQMCKQRACESLEPAPPKREAMKSSYCDGEKALCHVEMSCASCFFDRSGTLLPFLLSEPDNPKSLKQFQCRPESRSWGRFRNNVKVGWAHVTLRNLTCFWSAMKVTPEPCGPRCNIVEWSLWGFQAQHQKTRNKAVWEMEKFAEKICKDWHPITLQIFSRHFCRSKTKVRKDIFPLAKGKDGQYFQECLKADLCFVVLRWCCQVPHYEYMRLWEDHESKSVSVVLNRLAHSNATADCPSYISIAGNSCSPGLSQNKAGTHSAHHDLSGPSPSISLAIFMFTKCVFCMSEQVHPTGHASGQWLQDRMRLSRTCACHHCG